MYLRGGLGDDSLTAGTGDDLILGDNGSIEWLATGDYDLFEISYRDGTPVPRDVYDAVVWGERHALTGQIVTATVRLRAPESADQFKQRMRRFWDRRARENPWYFINNTLSYTKSASYCAIRSILPQNIDNGRKFNE